MRANFVKKIFFGKFHFQLHRIKKKWVFGLLNGSPYFKSKLSGKPNLFVPYAQPTHMLKTNKTFQDTDTLCLITGLCPPISFFTADLKLSVA